MTVTVQVLVASWACPPREVSAHARGTRSLWRGAHRVGIALVNDAGVTIGQLFTSKGVIEKMKRSLTSCWVACLNATRGHARVGLQQRGDLVEGLQNRLTWMQPRARAIARPPHRGTAKVLVGAHKTGASPGRASGALRLAAVSDYACREPRLVSCR